MKFKTAQKNFLCCNFCCDNENVFAQIVNWLKWESLNETLSPELRIAAFQSLIHCSEEEVEAVATLITQRDSHPQGSYNT